MDTKRKSPRRSVATVVLLSSCLVAGTAFATGTTCGCDTKVVVKKFYDANANGIWNAGEPGLTNWQMTLESTTTPFSSTKFTSWGGIASWKPVAPGGYTVREGTPIQTNWVQSSPVDANGDPINPRNLFARAGKTTTVKFGNYCTVGSRGRTPGFWGNRNGAATMADDMSSGPELQMLRDLNLVDANGLAFDPTSHDQLSNWLRERNATNMAYQLSAHLAAMALNVEAGFVRGNSTYVPFAGTINELMLMADQSLAANPLTFTGHPERAYQEQLKNYLDALNNNAAVVSLKPCKRSFAY